MSNKLGRLSNGYNNIKGTNTIDFVKKSTIPKHKKITYANMVCDHQPLKTEKYRVRLTIGGDKLDCTFDTASPAASLLETKLLLNSVISDAAKGARFITLDIKDFFCNLIFMTQNICAFIHGTSQKNFVTSTICTEKLILTGMYTV